MFFSWGKECENMFHGEVHRLQRIMKTVHIHHQNRISSNKRKLFSYSGISFIKDTYTD